VDSVGFTFGCPVEQDAAPVAWVRPVPDGVEQDHAVYVNNAVLAGKRVPRCVLGLVAPAVTGRDVCLGRRDLRAAVSILAVVVHGAQRRVPRPSGLVAPVYSAGAVLDPAGRVEGLSVVVALVVHVAHAQRIASAVAFVDVADTVVHIGSFTSWSHPRLLAQRGGFLC